MKLTHWTSYGVAFETKVALCLSVGEAQIFAAALDNVSHPAGAKIEDLLIIEARWSRMAPSTYYGRNGAIADPIIPTFAVACLAIIQ